MSLDSKGFYIRVCEALGIEPGRGAKAKIASTVGVTKTTAGSWEQGDMPGTNSLQSVAKISELSGASLHWLLTGKGSKEVLHIDQALPKGKLAAEVSPEIRAVIRREIIDVLSGLLLSEDDRKMSDSLLADLQRNLEKERL